MVVWKMIFLFQGCILRFHVNLPGCIYISSYLRSLTLASDKLISSSTSEKKIPVYHGNDYRKSGNTTAVKKTQNTPHHPRAVRTWPGPGLQPPDWWVPTYFLQHSTIRHFRKPHKLRSQASSTWCWVSVTERHPSRAQNHNKKSVRGITRKLHSETQAK